MFTIKTKSLGHFDVAVSGGGIAGVCAAVSAARSGASVVLIERSGVLGGTLTEGFIPLLLDSDNKGGIVAELYDFLNEHSMTIAKRGERFDENGRLIPGRMVDTEGCKYFFDKTCREAGVTVVYERVKSLLIEDGTLSGVVTSEGVRRADAVIVCTGGKSYPLTGSDGDGYRLAEQAGHSVTALSPSLVPLTAEGQLCPALQGVSLKNVKLTVVRADNVPTSCITND